MPIKKDTTGKRWVEMDLLLPGTPEQVWQALATGPGNTAWFVNAEIEPKPGGALRFDFGGGVKSSGEVTAWEPPHKLGYVERDWSQGAPPCGTEITVDARSGGRCLVRMVHSLFTSSEDWDDQLEGFEDGWTGYFAVLRVYLTHFAGARAGSFMVMSYAHGDARAVWQRIAERLGVLGANVGDRRSATDAPEAWSGVVEHVYQDARQRMMVFRVDAAAPGIALLGACDGGVTSNAAAAPTSTVSLARYYYGDDLTALAAERDAMWREWLTDTLKA